MSSSSGSVALAWPYPMQVARGDHVISVAEAMTPQQREQALAARAEALERLIEILPKALADVVHDYLFEPLPPEEPDPAPPVALDPAPDAAPGPAAHRAQECRRRGAVQYAIHAAAVGIPAAVGAGGSGSAEAVLLGVLAPALGMFGSVSTRFALDMACLRERPMLQSLLQRTVPAMPGVAGAAHASFVAATGGESAAVYDALWSGTALSEGCLILLTLAVIVLQCWARALCRHA